MKINIMEDKNNVNAQEMVNISQSLDKHIFIRYNPDEYKVGKNKKSINNYRMEVLKKY